MDELTVSGELTLFRDFRGDTPGPSAAETEMARARLLDAMDAHRSAADRRKGRWAWLGRFAQTRFWAPVAAAAAVTAVAITVALLAAPSPGRPAPHPSPASTHQPARPRHQTRHPGHSTRGAARSSAGQGPASQTGGKNAAASRGASSATRGASGPSPGPVTSSASAMPTTTTVLTSTGAVSPGQTVTLTATVSADPPGGTVTFYVDAGQNDVYPAASEPVCAGTQLTGSSASCTYTPQGAQTDLISAIYSGYGHYRSSESKTASLTVWQSTATTVTISSTQVGPGQTVVLTATVTDPAGDNLSGGTMGFAVDAGSDGTYSGAFLDICTHAALTYNPTTHDNVATCSYTPQTAQTDQFLAEYGGYGQYEESGSLVDLTVS
jgi:hypothetical protein